MLDSKQHEALCKILYKDYSETLKNLLKKVTPITLRLNEHFDMTNDARFHSWKPEEPEEWPAGTTILEMFERSGRGLLIGGEPGAGKTTLLYELALSLLKRAESKVTERLPLILDLSSWSKKRPSIVEWAAEELEQRYNYSRRVWRQLIQEKHCILLLDGLNEVATTDQSACINAINTYHVETYLSLVVCTRTRDYLEQTQRLALQSAVVIQPLSLEDISNYFSQAGKHLETMHEIVNTNPTLQKLLTTPLMLNVAISAYQNPAGEGPPQMNSAWEQQQLVFAAYIKRFLYERSQCGVYAPEKIKNWLIWLAKQMYKDSKSVLYLERMQPNWLVEIREQILYHWFGVHLPNIIIGALVSIALNVLLFGSLNTLISTLIYGNSIGPLQLLLYAIIGGIVGGWISQTDNPVPQRPIRRIRQTGGNPLQISDRSKMLMLCAGIFLTFILTSMLGGLPLQSAVFGGANYAVPCLYLLFQKRGELPFVRRSLFAAQRNRTRSRRWPWNQLFAQDVLNTGLQIGGAFGITRFLGTLLSAVLGGPGAIIGGLSSALNELLKYGLIGILTCFLFLFISQSITIEPVEILTWSIKSLWKGFTKRENIKTALLIGIGTTVIIGLSYAVSDGLNFVGGVQTGSGSTSGPASTGLWLQGIDQVITEFMTGLGCGLCLAGCYWLLTGLFGGVSYQRFSGQRSVRPNQGIRRSRSIGLLMGVLNTIPCFLFGGIGILLSSILLYDQGGGPSIFKILLTNPKVAGPLIEAALRFAFGPAINSAIVVGVAGGSLAFILSGGLAWWRHWVLRYLLWRRGIISWRYSKMLDEAAYYYMLYRVAGGYHFMHDLLRDYLASLDITTTSHIDEPAPSYAIGKQAAGGSTS